MIYVYETPCLLSLSSITYNIQLLVDTLMDKLGIDNKGPEVVIQQVGVCVCMYVCMYECMSV
jgi:hypothetical protein